MALSKGVNSYATVAEADAYFADRLDASAWVAADATTKAKALVTASSKLDMLSWAGSAYDELQSLAFPRSGYYFDPRLGTTVAFTTDVPSRVIQATYELANYYLNNEGLTLNPGKVDEIQVGSIKISGAKPLSQIPATVTRIIRPLLVNNGAYSWWRNN